MEMRAVSAQYIGDERAEVRVGDYAFVVDERVNLERLGLWYSRTSRWSWSSQASLCALMFPGKCMLGRRHRLHSMWSLMWCLLNASSTS